MILCKDVDDKDVDDHVQGVEIFGIICAKSNLLFSPKECYENHMFNVIEEEHVWVRLGTEIPLFKNLVALPAYSDLEISVNMLGSEDDAFIVQGTACFQPTNSFVEWKDIRGLNGFYVEVKVTYCEPSFLNQPFDHVDRVPLLCCVPRFPQIYASQILEVFSLFIARPNCKEVNLYGTVKIIDSEGCCTIFSCSRNEAYFLSRDCNFLPMQGPNRVVTPVDPFSIRIDLSDVDGHVKIKGLVSADYNMEELRKPWFDRRLCSVVGGVNKNSFAAVYYTSFSSAVQANLTVRHECKRRSSGCVKIYGDVIALYPKLASTNYYKKFFQIKLFTRNEVNPLEGEENFELSRTFLAVPIDFILQMKVDLYFQTSEGTYSVKKIKSLQIGEPCIAIERDDVNIFIDVMWKGLPYVSHECL
ncbi:uncharacterized protein LOC141724484 [Apium graveolens]|uniref:uncharacterized protein LOC141724484 n=1 Tax=Apium graveolens TaxID=4045 RepID=UPI003D7B22ED